MDHTDLEVLMTIYNGFENHKTIAWDTTDRGLTITLSVIDREDSKKSAIGILNMDAYELSVFIHELSMLRDAMRKTPTSRSNG